MVYLIGRDLDADGSYEFVRDLENMILTDDPARALQLTEAQLAYIDMQYLNDAGFYALEADRFQVSLLDQLLLAAPLVMGFRPRVAPPPRRRRKPAPPRHVHHRPAPGRPRMSGSALGLLGELLDPGPAPRKRPPKPHRGGPKPHPKPRTAGPRPRPATPKARGGGPAHGAGRGPGSRGPGDHGGRGPGR